MDTGEEPDHYFSILGWRPDGSELLFVRFNREHKKLDLMAANLTTGSTRVVLAETQETFVPPQWSALPGFTLLEDGKRFIWESERDGWNHLYLYDLDGNLIRRLTEGTFPVVRVVTVDEKAGWVYFTSHGDRQRPYDTHLYRIDFEGKGFVRLTEGVGQHGRGWGVPPIQFAPSKEFFVDTNSSIERPPAVELRRADGTLLQTISTANIDALKDLKWKAPEEFVVKAADGKTDLHGVLYKPYDFDPNKRYPVIEWIYAGPQTPWVPRSFTDPRGSWPQALAQLGFITFIVDGRGTPGRGKQFQDVVYGNFGRYEIPDHVATLKQLAEKRSYMDLSRVGVYGGSWGGYMTIRAMLLAPDVYHVGVALSPVVEAYQGAATHEPYIGTPQNNKEAYEYASNLRLVDNLKGKLFLSVGTSDFLFSDVMKMVDALIRADKPFELLILPEQSHGPTGKSGEYWDAAVRRYFLEHLKP